MAAVDPGNSVVFAALLSSSHRPEGETSLELRLLCGQPCAEMVRVRVSYEDE